MGGGGGKFTDLKSAPMYEIRGILLQQMCSGNKDVADHSAFGGGYVVV